MKLGELQDKIALIEKENFVLEQKLFELENKRDKKVIDGQLGEAGLLYQQ